MEEKISEAIIYADLQQQVVEGESLSEVERITEEFERHELGERQHLKDYKEIAEKTKNPMVKYLLNLIISDEEKHHGITHAMASTLRASLGWKAPSGEFGGLYDVIEEKEQLLKLTKEFIELEKSGISSYKEMLKRSEGYYRGLFALLLQMMIQDSEKHVYILSFLKGLLEEK